MGAENVRSGRLVARLSYSGVLEAARAAGCSREHLSKVLHGRRAAGAGLRERLAALGVRTNSRGERI